MLEIASQITLCLLIAAFIGFIIGFIVAKATAKKAIDKKTIDKKKTEKKDVVVTQTKESIEDEIETLIETVSEEVDVEVPTESAIEDIVEPLESLNEDAVSHEEITTEDEVKQPELLNEARDNDQDELTQIKGIGPKVAEKLNEAGIYHFDQIANWNEANIKWLEKHTTFAHRAKKDLWVNQAKALIK